MNDIEKNLRKNIGKKIKLARTKKHYTQEQLAEKLSLSTRYISQLERGIAFGSATTITSICNTLNISSNFLFDDIINKNVDNSTLNDLIDSSFLESYLQLDNHHRKIINIFTKKLVDIQNDDKVIKTKIK